MLKREFNLSLFVKRLFSKYYNSVSNFFIPKKLERREFGFIFFDGELMRRHIAFRDASDFLSFIRSNVPKHIYYSSAYYEYPDADNMNDKGWLGADLIFDIDVDHIPTPCKRYHDSWKCLNCGGEGTGNVDVCPYCGSERLRKKTWVCTFCLDTARKETLKLLDFLIEDFGFDRSELEIFFSGHRGFHVHIDSDAVLEMGQDSRREIADYVRGLGIDNSFFLRKSRKGLYRYVYDYDSPGWYRRLIRGIYSFLLKSSEDSLERANVLTPRIKNLLEQLSVLGPDAILESELSLREWKTLMENGISEESCIIDEKVTIDTKRLIRLPDSLHGKTGLRVAKLTYDELENEDILKKSIVFTKGVMRIYTTRIPRKVLDYDFGEIKSGVLEVPMYLGIYLLQNGGDDISLIKIL